ncbi:MAG: CotH kinase family protein [Bacteroidota bacterium]
MKTLLINFLLFTSSLLFAQDYNPVFGEEYVQDYLPSIEVTMDQADYDWMVHPDNIWSDEYQHATVVYKGSNGVEISYLDLGIRLRGNTSRAKQKKSFKLHFEKFTDDQYFFGLKKLNIKAETNDPSAVREHMVMNLYRESNIPVARVNHVKLYINSNYMGLYSSIEQVDSRFLKSRFSNDTGNLYKCGYGADVANTGEVYNDEIYELKTNEDENDRSKLEAFIYFMSNSSDSDFENNINNYLNVEDYVKQLAIEVLTGHWDGYSYNNNNFYLYYNPNKSWFEYIPYDTDNTLGIDWIDRDWSDRNVYDWAKHGDAKRPLYRRILGIEKYAKLYSQSIDNFIKTKFNTAYQMNIAYTYKDLISEAIYSDIYFLLDFGYSTQTFEDSYTENADNHVKYGIEPFIERRVNSAKEQLKQSHLSIVDELFNSSISVYPVPLNDERTITISTDICGIKSIHVSIRNTLGQEVYQNTVDIDNSINKINLNSLSNGVYIIKIIDPVSLKVASKKLLVN